MDLTKAKKATVRAAQELAGASRDVDWQSQDGWTSENDDLEPEERGELNGLAGQLQRAVTLVSALTGNMVKLEQKIRERQFRAPKKSRSKRTWQVTT